MSILRTALVVALVSVASATLADGPRVNVNVTNSPGTIHRRGCHR